VNWKSTPTKKPCPSALNPYTSEQYWAGRSRIPASRVTLQEAGITRRTLEAARWLWLKCWSNNVANSHLSPGALNSRVLRSYMVPQCSHPPHWLCHQWLLAKCNWIPASNTSGQPSHPPRHPTYWVSSTPCHKPWALAPLSDHLSIELVWTETNVE